MFIQNCGYELVREKGIYGGDIRSIYIPVFKNLTYEPHVSQYLTESFTKELFATGLFEVNRKNSDTYLEGVLKSFRVIPHSLDKNGIVIEKAVNMSVEVSLFKKDGNLIKKWSFFDSQTYRTDDLNLADYYKKEAISIISERIAKRFCASIITEY